MNHHLPYNRLGTSPMTLCTGLASDMHRPLTSTGTGRTNIPTGINYLDSGPLQANTQVRAPVPISYQTELQTLQTQYNGEVAGVGLRALTELRDGVDEGPPVTCSGRLKRRRDDEANSDAEDRALDDDSVPTPKMPKTYREASVAEFPFKQRSYHIRRAFDLFCSIHTVINDGLKRQARAVEGDVNVQDIQSDRDFTTYKLIMEHMTGLDKEIIRLRHNPMEFRFLLRKMKKCADNARNNDTSGLKKDVPHFLNERGGSVLNAFKSDRSASSKHDRGFYNDEMGRFLCPVSMDWDNPSTRQKIRDGQVAVTAADFPRLLYENCCYNDMDPEEGFGRNKVLVRVVKYTFTGRSSAFSETAGGKTTRAGNAEIAGMKEVTPRIIAYGACMLRFALSTQETWTKVDGEFNMEDFYWNVVEVFEESGKLGEDLLKWWNREIFGRSTVGPNNSESSSATVSTLERLRAHRQSRMPGPIPDRRNLPFSAVSVESS